MRNAIRARAAVRRASLTLALMAAVACAAWSVEPARLALVDCTGKTWHPLQTPGAKAVVLIFITNDCPAVGVYAPEIKRIHEKYQGRGVRFFLVEADPSTPRAAARKHARDYGFRCPVLMDSKHRLVALTGATDTTDCAVFTPDGRLQYRGRIDNRYFALGRMRSVISSHELTDVLDAVLQRRPVTERFNHAFGCQLPRP